MHLGGTGPSITPVPVCNCMKFAVRSNFLWVRSVSMSDNQWRETSESEFDRDMDSDTTTTRVIGADVGSATTICPFTYPPMPRSMPFGCEGVSVSRAEDVAAWQALLEAFPATSVEEYRRSILARSTSGRYSDSGM